MPFENAIAKHTMFFHLISVWIAELENWNWICYLWKWITALSTTTSAMNRMSTLNTSILNKYKIFWLSLSVHQTTMAMPIKYVHRKQSIHVFSKWVECEQKCLCINCVWYKKRTKILMKHISDKHMPLIKTRFICLLVCSCVTHTSTW